MSPSWCRGRAAAAAAEFSQCLESSRTRPKSANFVARQKFPQMRRMWQSSAAEGGKYEEFNLISEDGTSALKAPLACEHKEGLAASLMKMTHVTGDGRWIPAMTDASKTAHKLSYSLRHWLGLRLLLSKMSHWHLTHPKHDYLLSSVWASGTTMKIITGGPSSNRWIQVRKVTPWASQQACWELTQPLSIMLPVQPPDQTKLLVGWSMELQH